MRLGPPCVLLIRPLSLIDHSVMHLCRSAHSHVSGCPECFPGTLKNVYIPTSMHCNAQMLTGMGDCETRNAQCSSSGPSDINGTAGSVRSKDCALGRMLVCSSGQTTDHY